MKNMISSPVIWILELDGSAEELYNDDLANNSVLDTTDVLPENAIYISIETDGIDKFLGTFQADGASYDPEKDTYKFKAIHIAKKLFDDAKNLLPLWPVQGGSVVVSQPGRRLTSTNPTVIHNFDYVQDNNLLQGTLCDVLLDKSKFELAQETVQPKVWYSGDKPIDHFNNFLTSNDSYKLRDYWLDFAKWFKAVMFVSDSLSSNGLPILTCVPRRALEQSVVTGYDDFIAEYNEQYCNPVNMYALFPCQVQIGQDIFNAFALYCEKYIELLIWTRDIDPNGFYKTAPGSRGSSSRTVPVTPVEFSFFSKKNNYPTSITVPDSCVDLRVPQKLWSDDFNNEFCLQNSLPLFQCDSLQGSWLVENPFDYAERQYKGIVHPYKEITITYSILLPITPLQQLAVRGVNMQVWKIEDDIVNETSKVTGRIYQ